MQFNFENITISGGVAVGTTTLMNNLRPYLEPYNWQFKSTGQFVREYTKENVLPLATLVSDDFDRQIEKRVEDTLRNESNWVMEGWLAGYVARNLENTLRIMLVCSETSLRIDRVANRDKLSVHEAKEFIKLREEKNLKKWQRVYGANDFFNPKHYHMVIDTYSVGQMEVVGKVLDKLGYNHDKIQITKKP